MPTKARDVKRAFAPQKRIGARPFGRGVCLFSFATSAGAEQNWIRLYYGPSSSHGKPFMYSGIDMG